MATKKNADLEYGTRMALWGMLEIAALALMKGLVGYFTGIIVLMADALSSFSDMFSIFASYLGLKLSQNSANKTFNYGFYRAESFAAFVASLLIVYLGIQILVSSVQRFFVLGTGQYYLLALAQVAVSVLISIHTATYLMKAGKKVNSLSLINCAQDKKYDAFSQIIVVVGIAASFFQIPYLEGIIGIALALVILKVGYSASKQSLFFLLDYFDNPVLVQEIEQTILTKSRIVKKVINIRMRRAGTYIFGEAFLQINPFVDVKDMRNDLNYLHANILKLNKQIKDFQLLVEFSKSQNMRVAVPVKDDHGLDSEVAITVEETKYYVFVDVRNDKIVNSYCKPFEHKPFNVLDIADFFKKEKTNVVVNNGMHSLLFYNLKRLQHILVYPHFQNVTNVANTIKLLVIDT